MRVTLWPKASDVQVFPHHMVPATSTAPRVASILSSCPSAMRGIYPSGLSCPYPIDTSLYLLEESMNTFQRIIKVLFRVFG
jgi:hypothetical protein